MTAPAQILRPSPTAPDDMGATFAALAETMALAATYAETARQFAEIRDLRGAAYGVRSAAACISSAAGLLDDLRLSSRQGGRA